ncbi:MAG: hypothetical protein ACJ76I_04720 [Gaiellaceae bacterium]
MEGQTILTSDDHKLGTVIGERDDCVIIETGHVFKTKHALPREFVHEVDGELRATVPKSAVDDSPKIDVDDWDCSAIKEHYGLEGGFVPDPDPDDSAELDALRLGVKPAPIERLDTLENESRRR